MIAASIALAFALYFSATLLLRIWEMIALDDRRVHTITAVLFSASWATFYYLTHA